MTGSVSKGLEAMFGHTALPDGLFYRFPYALRLELSAQGVNRVASFLQAVDRARAVVRAVFVRAEVIKVVFAGIAPSPLTKAEHELLRALRGTGFAPRLRSLERLPLEPGEEDFWGDGSETLYRYLCTTRPGATMADIDALIWSCCAQDLGIEPCIGLDVFLIDERRGLALHIYDDRGLDLIAMKRATIVEYYRAFGPWLLDYDRARMDAVFAD